MMKVPAVPDFKCELVETWLLQPMVQYIITTRLDDVLHCFCFVFALVCCTCNGGFLPDILLLISTINTIKCLIKPVAPVAQR